MILLLIHNPYPKRKPLSSAPSSGGFLLLEILFSIAIFSIGFLAIGALIMSTARANSNANIFTQAALLASEKLESLKKEPVSGLAASSYSDPNNPMNEWGESGGIFNRYWAIDDPIGYDTSRRIRVSVSWERFGKIRKVELTTITRGNGS